jgi:hypothetical protein
MFARCITAVVLLAQRDFDGAKHERDEVEKIRADYRWLSFVRALESASLGKTDKAAHFLNQALTKSPGLEEVARANPLLKQLLDNPVVEFPGNEAN